jgi:hypothetical protein
LFYKLLILLMTMQLFAIFATHATGGRRRA